jgi:ABC-type multidrug transport system fused ATPase/permease subunit
MFGKDFTDPSTLLVAIGITVIVSVVEEDTKWRLYRRNSRYYYLWFSDGAGLPP